jgi:CubicO group peptidase (beta-lactamase class C family)
MRSGDGSQGRGLQMDRWDRAVRMAYEMCCAGNLTSVAMTTGTIDGGTEPVHLGRHSPHDPAPLHDDSIFLVASITKPIVATGAILLIERGQLTLADRVTDFIPEFGRNGKHGVEVRHLLTHTSGLPDMLPDNLELRQANASLSRFVERVCEEPLSFPPGRAVLYQSMGFSILGELIARITGQSCADFLRDELFAKVGMNDTSLGAPDDWFEGSSPKVSRIPIVQVPADHSSGTEWNWNSRYWRQLGAPWGGLLTSIRDLSHFARFMLRGGVTATGERLLSSSAIRAATCNQLESMRDVPAEERRCRPWGLGWRLNWPAHSANFGDLLGPRAFGHWGATGTVLWIDPDDGLFTVILTTTPQEPAGRSLSRLSNTIAAAWC